MAITKSSARLIASWVSKFGIKGNVLGISKQDVLLSAIELDAILKNTKSSGATPEMNHATPLVENISDKGFFQTLGFSSLESVDASQFEGSDHLFDLNNEGLDLYLNKRYDLLIETGTAEHIFHVPNYFKNVAQCLSVGGHAIHFVPANNYMDHGYYQFSPTLFYDYYEANNFSILDIVIMESNKPSWTEANVYTYDLGSFDIDNPQRFSGNFVAIGIIVRKEKNSTYSKIPQQRIYCRNLNWRLMTGEIKQSDLALVTKLSRPIQQESGYCWVCSPLEPLGPGDDARQSKIVLLEDGIFLGKAHALLDDIRKKGGGLYAHYKKLIYFSTSDNSDPNTNNKTYEVRRLD